MWVGLEGTQDEPGVLTPLEERAVEVSRGTSTPAGKEMGSPEGQGPCHVHLCSVYWNLALWGRGSVGCGEAMPERRGCICPPVQATMSHCPQLCGPAAPGPQTRSSLLPFPSGNCLTAGATSKLCSEIKASDHRGLISETPVFLLLFLCLSLCFFVSLPPLLAMLSSSLSSVHPLSFLPPFQISSFSEPTFPSNSIPYHLSRSSEPQKGGKIKTEEWWGWTEAREQAASEDPSLAVPRWVSPPREEGLLCHGPPCARVRAHTRSNLYEGGGGL